MAKMTLGITATAMSGPARPFPLPLPLLLPLLVVLLAVALLVVLLAVGRLRGSKVVGYAGMSGGESSPSGMMGALMMGQVTARLALLLALLHNVNVNATKQTVD